MARNSVVNIDDLLADERLHQLFQQLNLTEDNQKKLCEAFQHYFMTSTSTDMYLKKVKQELIKLSTTINQDDLKNIVGKISELVEEHSHVFYEALNHVRILEDNTNFLYNQVSKLQEESNKEEAFILANDLSTLYEEYFVKPVFLRRFGDGSWDKFTNRLSELEQETNKNILRSIQGHSSVKYEDLYAPLIQYLEPLQKEIDLSLTDIRYLLFYYLGYVKIVQSILNIPVSLLFYESDQEFYTHISPLAHEYFFNKFERCFQYNITEFLDGFNFDDSDIDTWSILCKQLSNGIMSLIAHVNSDDLDWLYCFCSAYQIPLLSSNNGHDRSKTNFSISLITDILSALTLWGREAHMCAWIRIQSVCDLSISLTIL
ncbi:unnamed protein product [Rotaria sp. Silwood1]|nr:unnamed protein product [Rotaria sp. Silwood1]CAF4891408.1 unnamed protein product [Rotaria sp. Silwood1]CAF4997896.1 unnamed protein product [Rotaria sp. Silwood1]